MSQNATSAPNTAGATFRTNVNNAFDTLVTLNSGTAAPGTTSAGMLWYDTTNAVVKQRNATNTAWIQRWTVANAEGTLSTHLLFTPDNTYDIGASGATRPRNAFIAGTITCGGVSSSGTMASAAISITSTAGTFITLVDSTNTKTGFINWNNDKFIFFRNGPTQVYEITTASNLKWGGSSAVRGTTEGTNHIDIFDGTAPVGTLANGVSLYSASGELRSMDSAGNSTLLSPHDAERNWIHHCLKGDGSEILMRMEQMGRLLDEEFGERFARKFGVPFLEERRHALGEAVATLH